jgi:hypothetical protein
MKKFGRAGSTFGTVIAAVVILALAGTTGAVAGGLITSKKIKNETIKSIDVKNGNLQGVDIADGSLSGADIANGSIGAADLAGGTLTSAYSSFHNAGVNVAAQVSGQDPTVLSLSVPAGSYVFTATTWLNNGAADLLARCTLSAEGDNDVKRQFLEAAGTGAYAASVTMQVVHTFASAGTAKLTCYGFGVNASANDSKITGVRVSSLSNVAG